MRRFLVVLFVVSLLALSSVAQAARFRAYRGRTSADTKIAFVIRVAASGSMSLKQLHYQAELVCEDASAFGFGSSWWFGGVGPRLDGRRLTLDEVGGSEALHITGVFRGRTADGTFRQLQAWLTEAEGAQLCTTGDLTWTAHRVPRDRVASMLPADGPRIVHRVQGDSVRSVAHLG